jgi:hypothetical protein
VDFKHYNWEKASYDKAFIQEQVIKNFTQQIEKYQTIKPEVHLGADLQSFHAAACI